MTRLPWRSLRFLGMAFFGAILIVACAPDQQISSGGDSANLVCSPWRLLQFYETLASRQLTKATGCLVVRQGETTLKASVAQLNDAGELLGWDGGQFSASAQLAVVDPSGTAGTPLNMVFYAYIDPTAEPGAVDASLCKKLDASKPLDCLADKTAGCLFALSFAPSLSSGTQVSLLDGATTSSAIYAGDTCRLFAAPPEFSVEKDFSIAEDAAVSGSCSTCNVGSFGKNRTELKIQRQLVYAVLQSPDGRFLITGQGGNDRGFQMIVYEKNDTTGAFDKEKFVVSLNSKPFRIRMSTDGYWLAVIEEKAFEVFDASRFFTGNDDKPTYVIRVPSSFQNGVAADLAIVSREILAVAFFERESNRGLLHLYAAEKDRKIRLLLEYYTDGLQALAAAPRHDWLFLAGRIKEGNAYRPQIHGLHIKGQPSEADFKIVGKTPTVRLDLRDTNITTLEISPDGRYMAGGTSPDTFSLRGPLGTMSQGKHGHLLIWKLRQLDLTRAMIVRAEGGGNLAVHKAFLKRLRFSPDGGYLVSLGAGGPEEAAEIFVWQNFEQDSSPFGLVESFAYGKPAFDIDFGVGCSNLFIGAAFAADNSSQPLTSWSGCE
ncbi:MAG: WD40 repeat domain-containing protein [Myxococcales bacterium]|nr:WD40 repeat domain-containing protein [Myxococcales bacterium]MCB9642014.1 WD40 repeat domain-containing protein [Myxococcales bacterium]